MTAWLPAIRLARRRYWLPLSVPTGDALAACLVSGKLASQANYDIITRCLVSDPAFFFLVLNRWQRSFAATPLEKLTIRLGQLVSFATSNWTSWFISGDSQLGAPSVTGSLLASWQSFYPRAISEPLEGWPKLSTQWLELVGSEVSSRQLELATVEDDLDLRSRTTHVSYSLSDTYGQFQLNLSQLVRMVKQNEQWSNCFCEQLELKKREAVKQFAYGLSHELNNPLANISVRAQGLLRDESNVERRKSLSRIVEQTSRAHDMLADLMFYAHPPQPAKRDTSIKAVIADVSQQYREQAAELEIEIRTESVESLQLSADPSMLAEAISVLVRNSIEAIGVHGRIDIGAKLVSNPKRPYLQVRVSDSGPGLSPQAVKHAFDPYFSGREAGRGLGVGLCRAWRIVQLHQGTLELTSAPVGCVAKLRLPMGK